MTNANDQAPGEHPVPATGSSREPQRGTTKRRSDVLGYRTLPHAGWAAPVPVADIAANLERMSA